MAKAYWMWNYGDYEIFHSNKANTRREEFGIDYPVFWRLPDVDKNVFLYCDFENDSPEKIKVILNGFGHLSVDGKLYKAGEVHTIAPGKHHAKITVTNLSGLPAAFIESDICPGGDDWYALNPQKTKVLPVGFDKKYDSPSKNPEKFIFEYKELLPVKTEKREDGLLYDFGKEIYGFLLIDGACPQDKMHVSYGESLSEAVDTEFSTVREDVTGKTQYRLRPRAFRYIFIQGGENGALKVSADYEYLPLEYKGAFFCDDESVNKIWDMCAYTLHLTSREVQLEAIKRDRWLWGGDSYQAYKFNSYLFFDKEIIRRSMIALRGKDPVYEHINTITDYSLFWIIGLYEYYLFYKDEEFIKFIYPKAVTLLDFCVQRVNGDGFIKRVPGDWIFIDWAEIDKSGESCISAEQMLLAAAYKAMAKLAKIVGSDNSYKKESEILTEKINAFFWDEEKGAYIDNYESGKRNVTRHANIFAILYNIASKEQTECICKNVLFNDDIPKITTPYFEGYELEAMGKLGRFDFIENKIRTYWKGMLDLGATTVWEEFDPSLSGDEHYAMYGKKYDKSLCHAWGAAPIYLLGRFFLGVYPTSPGYETFTVKPNLGGFKFMEGTVPVKGGEVKVKLTGKKLSVTATISGGTLCFNGESIKLEKDKELSIEF